MPSTSPTRRFAALTGAALAAALVLTGCGDSGDSGDSGGETRTITDASGKQVEVPVNPKRVVALAETDMDSVLALGVQPVGVVNGRFAKEVPSYLKAQITGDAKVVGDINTPALDKVTEVQPDLILAGFISDQAVLDQLRKITPAVVITAKPADNWKTTLNVIAEAVNKKDAAAQTLAKYDARVQEVKGKIGPNAGTSVSITRWHAQGPAYMYNDAFASLVVRDLGLTRPASQATAGFSPSDALSLENLSILDADWLFLSTLNTDGATALEEARKIPAFQNLNVVKNNHVVNVDGTIWTSRGGPTAAGVILDDVAKAMAG